MPFAAIFNNIRFILDVPSSRFVFYAMHKSFKLSSFTAVEVVVVDFIRKKILLDSFICNRFFTPIITFHSVVVPALRQYDYYFIRIG